MNPRSRTGMALADAVRSQFREPPIMDAASKPPPLALLEANGVTLQYKTPRYLVTATYQVDFCVHQGDRYVILGPSGCGKSTLLKAVGGFMSPVEGTMRIRGHKIKVPARTA